MVILFVRHILGLQPEEGGLRVRPKLLPKLDRVSASFPFRRGRLEVSVVRAETRPGFRSDGSILSAASGEALLAYPGRGLKVLARIPK